MVEKGVFHGVGRSPYKNCALGLLKARSLWPKAAWYCYLEFDVVLFTDGFKADLAKLADIDDLCLVGTDVVPLDGNDHWIVKEILNDRRVSSYRTLGAVMCFSNYCMKCWESVNFLKLLLEKTHLYHADYFPNFRSYAVEEVVFPSAAAAFGRILDIQKSNPPKYPVRFSPPVNEREIMSNTTMAHPCKFLDSPVRKISKIIRNGFLNDRLQTTPHNIISRIHI